jgi:hypothetical protein
MISSNSSTSSVTEGNTKTSVTKQISPAIRWCFTLNNYTEENISSIVSIFKDKAKLYIIGDEVGELGTSHLQGYVEFKSKCRPVGLFEFKPHWEKCKGTRSDNIAYCSKEKVLCSYNVPKPIKIIANLYEWQKNIENIYLDEVDDRVIHWFWEREGNKGKSAFIKYMIVKHHCLFCSGGKHSDIMNLVFNQDMDMCKGVFFDIPRANKGHISYASLEAIKNGLVCNTKYETGYKVFNSPHVFVFANFPPDDEDMLSDDRWSIVEL